MNELNQYASYDIQLSTLQEVDLLRAGFEPVTTRSAKLPVPAFVSASFSVN
jgi:hypothetical protein